MIARTKNNSAAYADLRARLIRRGYTLRSFALAHGYSIPTVYCAARGTRAGVTASRIAQHLHQIAYAETTDQK